MKHFLGGVLAVAFLNAAVGFAAADTAAIIYKHTGKSRYLVWLNWYAADASDADSLKTSIYLFERGDGADFESEGSGFGTSNAGDGTIQLGYEDCELAAVEGSDSWEVKAGKGCNEWEQAFTGTYVKNWR